MDQIIITRADGSIYPLVDKHGGVKIKSAKQSWFLLADDIVDINVESPFPQSYGIGDHFTVFGRVYKLNRLPKVKKAGTHVFAYDLEFEGIQYDLIRATYDLTIDTTNNQLQDVQADTLTGNLRRFAMVLLSNANRVFPNTWFLGSCPETIEDKTLTFGEGDNCLSVLQSLCTEFDVEFEIAQLNGRFTINFVPKVGQIFPFTFEFGKGKGLYLLDRKNVDSSNIVTRLKVYGSTSNITNKYRANRLCLPNKTKAKSYIEKSEAVTRYGIYEATKYFDDIKPTFDGSITGLVLGSVLKFIDTKMFDLNALEADEETTKYKMVGCAPKVHFNTGNLAGYEFEVQAYDHKTKTFTLVKQTDDRGDIFPSESSLAFQFAQGEQYKLLDVALPEIPYQSDAENKLNEQGNIYYDQNSQPKVQYNLSVTKSYLEKWVGDGTTVNIFAPGDYIPVKDSDIGVDKSVRIKSLKRNLLDEYEYELTISDTVSTNITNRVISELIDIDKIITINNLKDPARARANWRSSREVMNMVFDPEGDYYTEKIKPNSIDTLALSVGAKSMQFGLSNTVLQPNYNGDRNAIKVQGGVLTHYTINEESARSWVLADNVTTFTKDSQAYYIYAKCSRAGDNGSIIFSTEQLKVEQDAMFYHFWIGVVNSVDSELKVRSLALSYGFSMINGRYITTGRIQSSDKKSYFDLDNNEFNLQSDNGKSRFMWKNGKLITIGTSFQTADGEEINIEDLNSYSVCLSSPNATIKRKTVGAVSYLELQNVVSGESNVVSEGLNVVASSYLLKTQVQAHKGTKLMFHSDSIESYAYTIETYPVNCKCLVDGGVLMVTSISDLSRDDAYVNMDINCEGNTVISLRYSIAIIEDGTNGKPGTDGKPGGDGRPGDDGADAVLYNFISPVSSIRKNSLGFFEPNSFDVTLRKSIGSVISDCSDKYLTVFGSENGSNWVRITNSVANYSIAVVPQSSYNMYSVIATDGYNPSFTDSAYAKIGINVIDGQMVGSFPRQCGEYKSTTTYVYDADFRDCVYVKDGEMTRVFMLRHFGRSLVGVHPLVGSGVSPEWVEGNVEQFTAINTALIDGADIAGFLFKHELMISRSGKVDKANSTDTDNPNYIPNLSINGKTGLFKALNAEISGTINATSGNIAGLEIKNGGLGVNMEAFDTTEDFFSVGGLKITENFIGVRGSEGYVKYKPLFYAGDMSQITISEVVIPTGCALYVANGGAVDKDSTAAFFHGRGNHYPNVNRYAIKAKGGIHIDLNQLQYTEPFYIKGLPYGGNIEAGAKVWASLIINKATGQVAFGQDHSQ